MLDTPTILGTVDITFLEDNAVSKNNRMYLPEAVSSAVESAAADLARGVPITCFATHEQGLADDATRMIGRWVKVWRDGVKAKGRLAIFNTETGRDAAAVLKGEGLRTFSLRSSDFATAAPRDVGGKRLETISRLRLDGIDATMHPGLAMARVDQLALESAGAAPRLLESIDAAVEDTAQPPTHTGVMVGLWLEQDAAASLAIPGGEPAEDLHLTLAYLGDTEQFGTILSGRLCDAVQDFVRWQWPLRGRHSGFGRFVATPGSGNMDVFFATVDVPGLAHLREELAWALSAGDFPISAEHDWVPHVTLAYLMPGAALPEAPALQLSLRFVGLTVCLGGERVLFPFQAAYNPLFATEADPAVRALAEGWLPAGTTQGDLDDGDFAWLSDDYTAGKGAASAGRKLPYKIHGKVDEGGWRAAWTAVHGARSAMRFDGGPSKERVIAKLLRDKPEGIDVAERVESLRADWGPCDACLSGAFDDCTCPGCDDGDGDPPGCWCALAVAANHDLGGDRLQAFLQRAQRTEQEEETMTPEEIKALVAQSTAAAVAAALAEERGSAARAVTEAAQAIEAAPIEILAETLARRARATTLTESGAAISAANRDRLAATKMHCESALGHVAKLLGEDYEGATESARKAQAQITEAATKQTALVEEGARLVAQLAETKAQLTEAQAAAQTAAAALAQAEGRYTALTTKMGETWRSGRKVPVEALRDLAEGDGGDAELPPKKALELYGQALARRVLAQ